MVEEIKQPEEDKTSKAMQVLERMKVHKKEIDAQLKLADEKIAALQDFNAEKILSGTSDTGSTEQPKKEETAAEYKNRVMKNERS